METRTTILVILVLAVGFGAGRWSAPAGESGTAGEAAARRPSEAAAEEAVERAPVLEGAAPGRTHGDAATLASLVAEVRALRASLPTAGGPEEAPQAARVLEVWLPVLREGARISSLRAAKDRVLGKLRRDLGRARDLVASAPASDPRWLDPQFADYLKELERERIPAFERAMATAVEAKDMDGLLNDLLAVGDKIEMSPDRAYRFVYGWGAD